jgi:hypothetical protein
MQLGSTECLARLASENGYIVLNDDGVWLKQEDGVPMQFADGFGRKILPPMPHGFFDAYRKARLGRVLINTLPHSITSSARVRSDGGTSRPSTLAVLRLMTKSNLVD